MYREAFRSELKSDLVLGKFPRTNLLISNTGLTSVSIIEGFFRKLLTLSTLSGLFVELSMQPGYVYGFVVQRMSEDVERWTRSD